MKKSGKISCCGRGGSWFGKCRSVGDVQVGHTWYEGLQACKAQTKSKTVIGKQLNSAQQQANNSFNYDRNANSKETITAVKPLEAPISVAPPIIASVHSPVNTSSSTANATLTTRPKPITTTVADIIIYTSVNMLAATPNIERVDPSITTSARMGRRHDSPAHTPATSRGCPQLLDFTVYISLPLFVAFFHKEF